jgi:hypothetical protein
MHMTDIITSKIALTVSKKIFSVLKNAYQSRQQERVDSFFKCVETRYEYMELDEKDELNKSINSIEGQDILAGYVDAITQTSSDRVRMAIALLYCKDGDFKFSESEQRIFINGVIGITDHMVDFFIESTKQLELSGNYPYARHEIHQMSLPEFGVPDVDAEAVYAYVHDLIRRRLLLPDPDISSFADSKGWFVTFGTSEKSKKMARLLEKSGELLQ